MHDTYLLTLLTYYYIRVCFQWDPDILLRLRPLAFSWGVAISVTIASLPDHHDVSLPWYGVCRQCVNSRKPWAPVAENTSRKVRNMLPSAALLKSYRTVRRRRRWCPWTRPSVLCQWVWKQASSPAELECMPHASWSFAANRTVSVS